MNFGIVRLGRMGAAMSQRLRRCGWVIQRYGLQLFPIGRRLTLAQSKR